MNELASVQNEAAKVHPVLSMPNVAYVRPVTVEGEDVYAIHGSDGAPLGVAPNRELAFAAIRQHGLEPADAH